MRRTEGRCRRTFRGRAVRVGALAVATTLGLTACQTESTLIPTHSPEPLVVVSTASFSEAEIVGQILGNALVRQGWRARILAQAGTQDQVLDSLRAGETTLTIGFTGDVLHRLDPASTATSPEAVHSALVAALPDGIRAARPAPAEDAPAYVVSRNTARTRGLWRMSDLSGRCGEFVLGARPEVLADRTLSTAVGTTYDCSFARRDALGSSPREVARALRAGTVGVGVMQSTDPVLADDDMVALPDDADAITAQNIVPLYREGSLTAEQLALVDAISAELDTADVRDLLLGAEFGTSTPVALAGYWLDEHGY